MKSCKRLARIMGHTFIPNQMLFINTSLPTSGCAFLLLSPQTTRCLAVQSILCTLKPVKPNLDQQRFLTYSQRQSCMQVHTQDKDCLFTLKSTCVFARLIWLVHPFWSWSDSALNVVIMNRPRGVFADLQQQANEISKTT